MDDNGKLALAICDAASDYIERLAMFGRGELPQHLALPVRPLVRASTWKLIPESTKEKLADKNIVVEVLTDKGVALKSFTNLSPVEVDQVLDSHSGLLPAEKQKDRMIRKIKESGPSKSLSGVEESAYEFDSLRKLDNDMVLVFARDVGDAIGTQKIAVKISLKTLRNLVK